MTHAWLVIPSIPQVLVCRSAATSVVPCPAAAQPLVPACMRDLVVVVTELLCSFSDHFSCLSDSLQDRPLLWSMPAASPSYVALKHGDHVHSFVTMVHACVSDQARRSTGALLQQALLSALPAAVATHAFFQPTSMGFHRRSGCQRPRKPGSVAAPSFPCR